MLTVKVVPVVEAPVSEGVALAAPVPVVPAADRSAGALVAIPVPEALVAAVMAAAAAGPRLWAMWTAALVAGAVATAAVEPGSATSSAE